MSQRFSIDVEGVDATVEVVPPGLLKGFHVLVDGRPPRSGAKRGTFVLPGQDGSAQTATLKSSLTKTELVVAGRSYPVGDPVPGGLLVLACLPLALVGVGGLLGGACGGAAFAISLGIARKPTLKLPVKVLSILATGVGAAIVYAAIAKALLAMFG
ncbi:MAG: hypothetical protein AAGA56_26330 [Myxococcota bacterium]